MLKLTTVEFDQLMKRVKAGDADAAADLVRIYEPEIRREVRLRMTDMRMRRVLDSMDISQSVLANFFVKISLGEFDFDRPESLMRLLITMTRHKVIDRHRRESVRNPREKFASHDVKWFEPMDRDETPSTRLQGHELLAKVHARMTAKEKEIAECRRTGMTWNEIGARMGERAEAIRKSFSRALDRVLKDLDKPD